MLLKRVSLYTFLLLFLSLVFLNCADISSSEPEIIDLGEDDTYNPPISRGYYDLFSTMISSYGVNMHLLADQITSTNNVRGFYSAAQEPRTPIINSKDDVIERNLTPFFSGFNASINSANSSIRHSDNYKAIERNQLLANAYLIRGLARGYLGMIYDQALLIDENFIIGVDTPNLAPYSALIDAAIADLDIAISLTYRPDSIAREVDYSFSFDQIPGTNPSWNEIDLRIIANSFAARILAGKARTYEESVQTDWNRVLDYANKGIKSNIKLDIFSLSTIGSDGEFANYLTDWLNFVIEGDFKTGAGYLPTDLKILHLLDESYPTEYPESAISDGKLLLQEAISDDPRLNYYKYSQNKGFLNEERNPILFSNYLNKRMYADNDWWSSENKIVLFTEAEIEYLKAEAYLMLGNKSKAASVLNMSPAGSGRTYLDFILPSVRYGYSFENSLSGNYQFTGNESISEFQLALLREYSIEIDALGGIGVPWFFMRRHNLLQKGTPTMYPIPDSELQILDISTYTFGGVENAGQPGTASGANSWKNLRAKIASE